MLYFRVKKYLFFQEVLALRYYKNLKFAFLDVFQKIIYAFINPYRVSKKFLIKSGFQDVHLYGETPIKVFDKLLQEFGLTKRDIFFELGCGRGRLCYFVSSLYKCNVIGIEQIPTFVRNLRFLQKIFRLKNFEIVNKDMFDVDYCRASFIYLYGTCLKDSEIYRLVEKFKNLKKGTKVLTISISLKDYDESFLLLKKLRLQLPWGTATAYFQVKD